METDRQIQFPCRALRLAAIALAAAVALPSAHGGKVLVYPGGACYNSHSMVMESLAALLSKSGHRVSMIVSSDYAGPKGAAAAADVGAVELLRFPVGRPSSFCGIDVAGRRPSMLELIMAWQSDVNDLCESLLSQTALLSRLKAESYDLFIVDNVDLCSRVLVDYVDVPFIVFSTARQPLTDSELIDYLQVPHIMLPFTNEMTLVQRVVNAVIYMSIELLARLVFMPTMHGLKVKYGLNTSLSLARTYERSAVNFLYTDATFDYPLAAMPKNIAVGAFFAESRRAERLDAKLREFMDAAGGGGGGVAVVSFGSRIDALPQPLQEALLDAFRRSPLAVVWRSSDPARVMAKLNNSVALPWLPQAELLAHPNTKLLVCHGGFSGLMEAAYNGVPVVTIPMQSEEKYQSLKITQYLRMGVNVDVAELSGQRLRAAIAEVADNPTYRLNARSASRRIRDKPMVAREQILFWVDYVIRNRGGFQTPPSQSLTWYQSFLLDVIAVLLTAVVAAALLIYVTCRVALATAKVYLLPARSKATKVLKAD